MTSVISWRQKCHWQIIRIKYSCLNSLGGRCFLFYIQCIIQVNHFITFDNIPKQMSATDASPHNADQIREGSSGFLCTFSPILLLVGMSAKTMLAVVFFKKNKKAEL